MNILRLHDEKQAANPTYVAALAAKYVASGEKLLTIDFTGAGLSAEQAAAVLLGARLRSWRYD